MHLGWSSRKARITLYLSPSPLECRKYLLISWVRIDTGLFTWKEKKNTIKMTHPHTNPVCLDKQQFHAVLLMWCRKVEVQQIPVYWNCRGWTAALPFCSTQFGLLRQDFAVSTWPIFLANDRLSISNSYLICSWAYRFSVPRALFSDQQ